MRTLHRLALILGVGLLAWAAIARADGPYILQWERVSEIWLTPSQVRMYGPGAVQSLIDSDPQYQLGCQQPDMWCTADLTVWGVPADAKYAMLTGILLISHGASEQSADIRVTFRKPGDATADCQKYLGQAANNRPGGGARSGMATWVPLAGGKTEYCFEFTGPLGWPTWSSYGINLSVQAWAR